MDECITTSLNRKIQAVEAFSGKGEPADFIYSYGETILLDAIVAEREARDDLRILLLHHRGNTLLSRISKLGLMCDQTPFAAVLAKALTVATTTRNRDYNLLVSHLVLNWVDAGEFILQAQSVLSAGGDFWLTCYGDKTASKSRDILSSFDNHAHFNEFYQLQDIGDALQSAGFQDVVVESRVIELEYQSVSVLMKDARRIFGQNAHPDRRRGLTPRSVLSAFKEEIEKIIERESRFVERIEILSARGRIPIDAGTSSAQIPVKISRE